MKNLKLTNLEKMQENEMKQIKGGGLPYIYHAKPLVGDDRCWCAGFCGSTTAGRKQEGQNSSKMNSHD